jgi:diguanylate cyclase (GGDEF)-like protein
MPLRRDAQQTAIHGMRRRPIRYALSGGVLGFGAPAGLLLLRVGLGQISFSLAAIVRNVQVDFDTYLYVAVSTTLAFGVFGAVLGRYADELARLATTDPLTGLFNARAFHERLGDELRRAARSQEPFSVLVVDLDGLKAVNDRHGHQAGDSALRLVANAIRRGVRQIDLGARLGGDEFAILAPGTDEPSAIVLAERLRALVAVDNRRDGPRTTISIGIASLVRASAGRSTALSLMAAADEALYRAKSEGRNRVAAGGAGSTVTESAGGLLHADDGAGYWH